MGPLQFMSFGSTVVGKMVRINLQTRLVSAGLQPLSGEQFNHNMDEGRLDVVADSISGVTAIRIPNLTPKISTILTNLK